jgi:hypothetical protein
MKFPRGTSQAQMAAATAALAANKPKFKSDMQAAAARGAALPKPMRGNMMSAQQIAAINKQGAAAGKAHMQNIGGVKDASGTKTGLGAAMSGPKTGLGTKTGLGSTMSGPKTGLGTAMGGFPYVKAPAGGATRAKPPVGGSPQKTSKPTSAVGKAMGMMKEGGSVGSASKRADGIAVKGKTKGKMMSKGGKAC